MYKITRREITFDDYLKIKKFKPFKDMRTSAKVVNFGTIFNCTGGTLGRQMKGAGFSETDCDDAIDTFNLEAALNTAITNNSRGLDVVEIKYNIVGSKLRELFFQTYPCLLQRVEREQQFALKHGYVRTWTGPVRHLAELRFMSHRGGNVNGMDKKLFSRMFSHLKNNAANSTIQTAEVYQAMPDVTALHQHFKRWNLKTRVWGYVHDSINLYLYRPERDLVYALLNKLSQINRQPFYNLPQHIDVTESDLEMGEYFKSGREINIESYDLDVEIAKWNELHNENIEFDVNCIPIHGEVK
jgi:DNA polymerase I-like protein with 3'-5' exonuclease and polymerase domains